MAAPREQSPKPEASEGASASGAASEPAPAVEPEPAPEREPAAPRHAAAEPVHTYKAPRPTPFRAGGHVLTERGWVLDTNQEA